MEGRFQQEVTGEASRQTYSRFDGMSAGGGGATKRQAVERGRHCWLHGGERARLAEAGAVVNGVD